MFFCVNNTAITFTVNKTNKKLLCLSIILIFGSCIKRNTVFISEFLSSKAKDVQELLIGESRMANRNLLQQVREFKNHNLKSVSTNLTFKDGQKYIETLRDEGYHVSRSGYTTGYVIDNKADITVSLIMDGLILGSQDVAAELKILNDFNITHILNVGYRIPNHFESKFIYKNVEVLDDPSTNIAIFFEGCFEFIDDGRHEGCVLVHCNAGVSRAPTIVVAYLMKKRKMTLKEAINLVKSVRANVRPNEGFMKVLQEYEKEVFKGS